LCRRDATIVVYRAPARNVFGLEYQERQGLDEEKPIRLLSIGTVEPRKNYLAAADIRRSLQRQMGRPVELHIVGRPGWGSDYEVLGKQEGVTLHGFLDDLEMRALVDSCDAYLYTTHAEGLGLPVLEVQHSGIPVISNDLPILRESLANSGLFIDANDPEEAAKTICASFREADFFPTMSRKSADNVRRWNDQAHGDRDRMLAELRSSQVSQG
jgi:glycosyltransferase involved in cell wall biosynthesis